MLAIAGDPYASLELLLPSLCAVAAGGLLGFLLGLGHRAAFTVLLLLFVASVFPQVRNVPFSRAQIVLPRAAFLIGLGVLAGRVARAHFNCSPVRFGLAVGVLLCAAKSAYRLDQVFMVSRLLIAASTLALAADFTKHRGMRWGLTALAFLIPLVRIVPRVQRALEMPRADVSLRAESFAAETPSVLIVVLDTVRADHLAPYGYERVTTPGLDAFVSEHATRYDQVRSTSSWTLPAHASLLTGLAPAQHGATHPRAVVEEATALRLAIRRAQPVRTDVSTLAERMSAAGLRTGAIVANHAYLDYRFGLDRGFERYDDRTGAWLRDYVALGQMTGHALRIGHVLYRDAGSITDAAIEWIGEEEQERPFFLLVNYMDAHSPYYPPSPYDDLYGDEEPIDPLRPARALHELLYDRCLAYMDAEIMRLVNELETLGRFDDTVVIVTSDHGEGFGEHGFWTHAWTLYDELLRVPLYIKPAGGRSQAVDKSYLTLMDVHDLVLELTGLEPRAPEPNEALGSIIGEWFHPGKGTRGDLVQWAAKTGRDLDADLLTWIDAERRKWIIGSDGSVEVYDLTSDPKETSPLTLAKADVEAALERARAWWQAHPPRAIVLDELDADTLERMKALGYVGDE